MSKTAKKLLLLIMLVIAIIIGILAYMLARRQGLTAENEYTYIEEEQPKEELSVLDVRNNFYIVKDCINKYFTYCGITNNVAEYYGEVEEEILSTAKRENAEIVYNMLDPEYLNANGINKNNIANKIEKVRKCKLRLN